MKELKKILSAVSAVTIAASTFAGMALTVSAKTYAENPVFDATVYDYSSAVAGTTSITDIWDNWTVESGQFLYQKWGGIDTCGFEGPAGKLVSPGYCEEAPGYKIEFVMGKADYCHDTMILDADGEYIFGYAYAASGDGFYPQDGERNAYADKVNHLKEVGNPKYDASGSGNYRAMFNNDKSVMRIEVENFTGAVEGTNHVDGDYYTVIYSIDVNGDNNFVEFATEYYEGSVNGFGGFEVGNNAAENAAYGKLKITTLAEATEPGEEPEEPVEEPKVTIKYGETEKNFSDWGNVLTEIQDVSWSTIEITINEDITLDNQKLLNMDAETRNNTIYIDAAEGKDVTITVQNLSATELIFLDSNRAGSGSTYIGTRGGNLTIVDQNQEDQLATLCKGNSLTLGENLTLTSNAESLVFAWETPSLVFENFDASNLSAPLSSTNTGVCTFKLVGNTILKADTVFTANVKDKLDVTVYTGEPININVNNPSVGLEVALGTEDKLSYENDDYILSENEGKVVLAAKTAPEAVFNAVDWQSTDENYTVNGNILTHKESNNVFYGYKAEFTSLSGTYNKAIVKDSEGTEKGEFESTMTFDGGGAVFYMITDKAATDAKVILQ